jgi:hypothetical protein
MVHDWRIHDPGNQRASKVCSDVSLANQHAVYDFCYLEPADELELSQKGIKLGTKNLFN